KEHFGNRAQEHVIVAARQIRSADRTGKQRVADKQVRSGSLIPDPRSRLSGLPYRQAYAARAMAGRVVHTRRVVPEGERLGAIELINGRRLPDLESEQRALLDSHLVEE